MRQENKPIGSRAKELTWSVLEINISYWFEDEIRSLCMSFATVATVMCSFIRVPAVSELHIPTKPSLKKPGDFG